MTRDNRKAHRTFRRHSFRLALCIALTTNASLTCADSGQVPQTQVTSCTEPVYPFPSEPARTEQQTASKRAIIRLLGIRSERPLAPLAKPLSSIGAPSVSQVSPVSVTQVSPVHIELPSLPSLTPVELPTTASTSSPTVSAMPALIETKSLPELSLANVQLPSLPSSDVVAANAIRPIHIVENAAQEVVHRIEDVASEENSLAMELMSSLDDVLAPSAPTQARKEQSQGFSDTLQVEVGSDEPELPEDLSSFELRDDSVNFSLSDQPESTRKVIGLNAEAADRGTKGTPKPIQAESSQGLDSRKPELANTKQSSALRAVSTENSTESSRMNKGQSAADSRGTLQAVPRPQAMPMQQSLSNAPMLIQKVENSNPMKLASPPRPVDSWNASGSSEISVNSDVVTGPFVPQSTPSQNAVEVTQTSFADRPPLVPLLAGASGHKQPEKAVAELAVPSKSVPAAPGASESVKEIKVMVKDAVALQSADPIQGWSVEHEGVCQVIQTGHKSYSVVGLQPGETRVALFTDVAGKRNVQIHQVAVGASSGSGASSSNVASDVAQTIQQLFPQSKVRITTRNNQLVVSGKVDSEDSAKKILSLVRKTTLVPVIDELRTR